MFCDLQDLPLTNPIANRGWQALTGQKGDASLMKELHGRYTGFFPSVYPHPLCWPVPKHAGLHGRGRGGGAAGFNKTPSLV